MANVRTNFTKKHIEVDYTQIAQKTYVAMHIHDISRTNTLNITGGVPHLFMDNLIHKVSYESQSVSFFASTVSDMHEVERQIFPEDRFIDNLLMKTFKQGKGIGTNAFVNQVIEARNLGYKFLQVSAFKSDGWNGFYTWARLGYSMLSSSQNRFDNLMLAYSRSEQSIVELMKTEEGRAFWKRNGFTWAGKFDLADRSENMNALYSYLISKGNNVIL
jgi:hypothetical protein